MDGGSILLTCKELVEPRLDALLPQEELNPKKLHRAMRYSVLSGGKRLRPALAMATGHALGAGWEAGIEVGCATEFVHCFSLIHDDLPSIDNDDLRRGIPTVHKQFDEATAVLAGDALFALAFHVIGQLSNPIQALACLRSLSLATGGFGLVGGEVLDVESEGAEPDVELVELIHRRKTGALMASACEMGAIVSGASPKEAQQFSKFGMELGLAFQIVDDILNEIGTEATLGKAAGSDRARGKMTYPAAIGIESSKLAANTILEQAVSHVEDILQPRNVLIQLARAFVERES